MSTLEVNSSVAIPLAMRTTSKESAITGRPRAATGATLWESTSDERFVTRWRRCIATSCASTHGAVPWITSQRRFVQVLDLVVAQRATEAERVAEISIANRGTDCSRCSLLGSPP